MVKDTNVEVVQQILALIDYSLGLNFGRQPRQGQFVITGPQMGGSPERRIGFCVQIRKNSGQFGSDMVFIRHPDGGLVTHENQSYFAMTEEQERLARSLFKNLPEDEDYSHGYTCCAKVREVGFIVENSASQPAPVTPSMLTITETKGDGSSSATCVAFV